MTATIEHVRHRVATQPPRRTWEYQLQRTACGLSLIGVLTATRDTRHHQPATSRCARCYP